LSGGETEPGACGALHETYAHLYVGDYFADTLDLTVIEHVALRLLLLETWVRGPVGNVRLASVTGLTREEWQTVKPAILPLLRGVQPRIAESLKRIRAFDGRRLSSADWEWSEASFLSATVMSAPIAVRTSCSKAIISSP